MRVQLIANTIIEGRYFMQIAVPDPSTILLLGAGFVVIGIIMWRYKK